MSATRLPAVDGWFASGPGGPHLIGTRCTACATVHFPPEPRFCRNPRCAGGELPEIPLSRRGRVWSYTDCRYPPPPPFVSPGPFVPFTLAAVELAAERIVVLGRVAPGTTTADLSVGCEMELVEGTLPAAPAPSADPAGPPAPAVHTVWNWRPVPGPTGSAE
ncbi:Zn-ribbon domain-containing OB-fold protein [Nocardiopsis mangrovi]|uniref:Zn-ribbon domain-containing OB-fold protein n=1 Tax=Nocardiopsis mangrovi TaxID=1179818 RepID=A0ABV9E4H9_9ACTN